MPLVKSNLALTLDGLHESMTAKLMKSFSPVSEVILYLQVIKRLPHKS
jgi:hypothetical protein